MSQTPKLPITLRPIKDLDEELERLLIKLHHGLNNLKLRISPNEDVPPIETSSAELIRRANNLLLKNLTINQPENNQAPEKIELKVFYSEYLIGSLAAINHAFAQSKNLNNYLDPNRANYVTDNLIKIDEKIKTIFTHDQNLQYTQIKAHIESIHKKISDILQNTNDNRQSKL